MARSYVLLVLCVTLWGSNFVFGSILVQEFPPMLLSAIRLIFTSSFLLSYAIASKRLVRLIPSDWKLLIPLGFFGTLINQTAFFTGLQTTDATTASLITSLVPITTAFLAAVFLGEKFTRRMFTGSIVAIVGVFFVVGKGAVTGPKLSWGVLLIFVAMITFALSMILVRKLSERLDPFITTVYATVIGSSMMVPAAFIKEPLTQVSHHLWAWVLAIGTAIVMQGVCGLIWNQEMKQVGAGRASMFINLQPFVAMLVGFLLLGTTVTASQMIGSLLIIAGVIVATSLVRKTKENKFTHGMVEQQNTRALLTRDNEQ